MTDDKLPDIRASDKTADDKTPIARRNFLLGAGTAVAAGLAPTPPAEAQTPQPAPAAALAPDSEPVLTLTGYDVTRIPVAYFVEAIDTRTEQLTSAIRARPAM